MSTDTIAYVIGTGWLGGRIFTVLVETSSNILYGLRQTKRQSQLRSAAPKKQPLISVVVAVHNNEATIRQCLASILDTSYRRLNVAVINNGSNDKTIDIVRRFKRSHPKLKIEIIGENKGADAASTAAANKLRGELVLHLDGRCMVEKNFFKNALKHFEVPGTDALIPAVRVKPEKSLLGLLQQYDALHLNVANAEGAMQSAPYVISRNKPLKKPTKPHYADDVLLVINPLPSYTRLFNYSVQAQLDSLKTSGQRGILKQIIGTIVGIVLLLEPFVVGYFVYLALKFQRPEALALAWALTLFSLFFYVWADRHTRLLEKLRLIFLSPMISSLTYLLSLSRILAPIKYLAIKVRDDWNKWQPQPA